MNVHMNIQYKPSKRRTYWNVRNPTLRFKDGGIKLGKERRI